MAGGGGSATGTTSGFTDGTGTSALFAGIIGLAIDSNNNIFVADYSANTIRKVTPAGDFD